MASDVCKHCTHAACLDVCPTGALMRTEFGTVVVQQDVCNGCGYCIPACPYGVIDRREGDGRAWKCTMCYDRLGAGMEPACAKACPTDSIQFGPLDELRERAAGRLDQVIEAGEAGARLYGADPGDGVGGDGAFFLLLDEPEAYGLPPDPVVTTRDLPAMWRHVGVAAVTLAAAAAASFAAAAVRRPPMSAAEAQARQTRWQRKRRAEQRVVPRAEFTSYYGKPVLNPPVWASPDIPGYLFLGGLSGAASLLGAGADLTGRPALAATAKVGATAAIGLSLVALVHDLGRPARFLNMMRVFKVTSPMSVGSWLLAGYAPAIGVATASSLTRRMKPVGAVATAGSAVLGPAVAAYTAALISDTAVPAWHEGYRELPFVFTGSGAMAAGGLGLLGAPVSESGQARNLALLGWALEAVAFERMKRRTGLVAEPYETGRGGAYMRASQVLGAVGVVGAALTAAPGPVLGGGRGRRVVAAASGAALIAASAATRWGVFHAGMASARDPKYTVVPQRERLRSKAKPLDETVRCSESQA